MIDFGAALDIDLKLTIAGTDYPIPGGSITSIELDLRTWGFSGEVAFWLANDAAYGGSRSDSLHAAFLKNDLVAVALSLAPHYPVVRSQKPAPIEVAGLVRSKRWEEPTTPQVTSAPVLARRYRVEFADAAQVLWRQHHPVELLTGKTMKQMIEAHAGSAIAVDVKWQALAEQRPLLFVHLPRARGATFYDFVSWYADTRGGAFRYDYKTKKCVLDAAKDASPEPQAIAAEDVAAMSCVCREVPRHEVNVLNSYTEGSAKRPVSNAKAASGVRHDRLMRSSIPKDVDDLVAIEKARLQLPLFDLDVDFAQFPPIELFPNRLYSVAKAQQFSADLAATGITWRMRRCRLAARRQGQGADEWLGSAFASYAMSASAYFEQSGDPTRDIPDYVAPSYPAEFEGRVVSEPGADTDKTYQVFTEEGTSLQRYKVEVPLWDKQTILVPFEPYQGSGNVFLPAYKKARVLLSVGLDSARVAWLLDWRDGVVLPQSGQGENLLFGKNGGSNTSVNHVYKDDKPVFTVERTNAKDNAFLTIEEGALTIKVWEKAQ